MPKPSFLQTVFRKPSRSYADPNGPNPWSDFNSFDEEYYRPSSKYVARMENGVHLGFAQTLPSRSRGYGSEVAGPSSRPSRPTSPTGPARPSSSMSSYSVMSDAGPSSRSSFPKPAKKSRSSVFVQNGELYSRSIGQILEEGSARSPSRSETGVKKKKSVSRARSEAGGSPGHAIDPLPSARRVDKPKSTFPPSATSSRLSSPVMLPVISAPPPLVPRSGTGRAGSSSTDGSSPIPPASPKVAPVIRRQSSRHKISPAMTLSPPLSPVQSPTMQIIREVRPKAPNASKAPEKVETKRTSVHQRNVSDVSHIALPEPGPAPAPVQTVAPPRPTPPPPAPEIAPPDPSLLTQAPEPSPPIPDERVTRRVSIAVPPRQRSENIESPVRKAPHPVIVSPSKEPETEDEAGFYTPRQSVDTLRGGSIAASSDDGRDDIPAAIMALRAEHISPGFGAGPVTTLAPPLFTVHPPTPAEIKDPEVSPFHSESSSKTTSPLQSPPLVKEMLRPPGASPNFNPADAFADADEDQEDAHSASGDVGSDDEDRAPTRPPKSNLRNSPVIGNSPRMGGSPAGSRTPSESNSAEPGRIPSPNGLAPHKSRSRSPLGSIDGGRPASRTSTTRSSQKHESQRYDDIVVHRRPSFGGQSAREGSVRSNGALGKGGWAAAQAVSKSGRSSPVSMYMPSGGDGWEHFQNQGAVAAPPRQSKFTPLPSSSQPLGFDKLVYGSSVGGSSVGDGYSRGHQGLAPPVLSGGSEPSEYSDDASQVESGPQPSRSYIRSMPTSPGPPVQAVLPHQALANMGLAPPIDGPPGAPPYHSLRSGSTSRSGSSPSLERWADRDTVLRGGQGVSYSTHSQTDTGAGHGWDEANSPPPPTPQKDWSYPAALEQRLSETSRMSGHNGYNGYDAAEDSPATITQARMDKENYAVEERHSDYNGDSRLQHHASAPEINRQRVDDPHDPALLGQRLLDAQEDSESAFQRHGPYSNINGRVPVPYARSDEMLTPLERNRPMSIMTDTSIQRPPSSRGFDAPSLLNPDSLTLLPEMSASDSERTYKPPSLADWGSRHARHASMPATSVKRNASVRSRQSMSPSMLEREAEDVVYDLPQRRALSPLPGGRSGLAAQWETTSSAGEGVLMESNGRLPDSTSGYTNLVLPAGAYTPVNPAKTSTGDINSRILGLPHTTMAAITLSSSLNRAAASDTPLHLRHQLPPPVDFSSHLKPPTKVNAGQLLVQIYAVAIDESDVRTLDEKGKGEIGKWVPGRSFVGRCIMVGQEEKDLVRGDIVLGLLSIRRSGALSEYTLVERRRIARAPQPSSLTLEQMALLPMLGIPAVRAARTHMARSTRALIFDAHEGIAALVCQEMARAGVNVTAVIPGGELHHEAQSACMANGARGVLTGSPAAVMLQLDEDGWDFIFDTVGGQRVYDTARRILKSGAKLVTTVKPDSNMLSAKNATVKPSGFKSLRMAFSSKRKDSKFINFVYLPPAGTGEPEVDTSGVDIRDTLEEATMDAFRPVVGQVLPFERGADAFKWTRGQIPAVVRLIN